MEIATILLGAIVIVLALVYRHLTRNNGQLEQLGIPVVKPFLIFGSPPFGIHKIFPHELTLARFKEFGTKTYGRYEGVLPVIVTLDTDIIKSVLVKNFDSFTDLLDMHIDEKHQTLDIMGGNKWRSMRKHLSPTFTSRRLKAMMEPMADVADGMMSFIDETVEKEGDVVDVKHIFQGLALSIISRCAFGIETDAYRDRNQPLIKYGTEIFTGFRSHSWFESLFSVAFAVLPDLMNKMIDILPPAYGKFFDITKDIIDKRVEARIEGTDFIARLMELVKLKREDPNNESIRDVLEENIIAQGTVFFIAGYETTANTLSTFCYNMAKHPEIQERIYEEISDVMGEHKGKIDHETVGEMTFLDAAINENLRLNGPITNHFRLCVKDCELKPGMTIRKGTRVEMPLYASHHTEEYFPNPELFMPERFLKENKDQIKSFTFRPFGDGPRACIGTRFAMTEMKLALAKLMRKYRIVDTPETKIDLYKGDLFLFAYPEVRVKLQLRK